MGSTIAIIACTLLLSAFFSGIEIAFVSANKLRIELKNKKGYYGAQQMAYFLKHPSSFLTTTLIGNNIALVIYGIFIAQLLDILLPRLAFIDPEDDKLIFLLQTIIGALIVLVLGEFLPKSLFRATPNRMLQALSLPFLAFHYLLWPIRIFVQALSKLMLKAFLRTDLTPQEHAYTRHDLVHYVTESATSEEESVELDKEIFKNAIEFPLLKVRDCLIPRTEVVAIEVTQPIETLREKFVESGLSKIIVFRETVDNVIGYVSMSELYSNPKSIDRLVKPIVIATESTPASELLRQLIDARRSIALVVDEFGGTSGIVTIEDILEMIIGDIEDEHDKPALVEEQISENEFIFSARHEVEYLNERYKLAFPEGDYDTLGGMLFFIHQNIPKPQDVVRLPPYEFTVLSVNQTRIEEVRVKVVGEGE